MARIDIKVNELEKKIECLSDDELREKTKKFKMELEQGKTLDDIVVEAFAVVREACRRITGKRLYDVQVQGGYIISQGRIAEIKAGEGKTLTESLPAYLNALEGEGVHIITTNEYLAKRDYEEVGEIFKFLGLR